MLRYNICSAWFLDIRISTCYIVINDVPEQSSCTPVYKITFETCNDL